MARVLPLLLLMLLSTRAYAQDPVKLPGRQVVEAEGYLAEVVYTSLGVQIRVYDLEGEPIDLRDLWLRRCAVEMTADRGEHHLSRSARVRFVEPSDAGLPYLEAHHQFGRLEDQDELVVCVRLKNLDGRGDRTVRFWARWERIDGCHRCCSVGVECRRTPTQACRLCTRRLCRQRDE